NGTKCHSAIECRQRSGRLRWSGRCDDAADYRKRQRSAKQLPTNTRALGNLYFVKNTVEHVLMWNFVTHKWSMVDSKSIYSGNIEAVPTKEKAKFPQQFFPESKWSRKGFLRTRWFLNGTIFDLVNIHLFHDASNFAACEKYPSVYSKSRNRALVYILERFRKDRANLPVPYFLFGDFNFRCDTMAVIKVGHKYPA
ncbi:inositol polyphosphate-5-phosphatase A, partial [Anopheles bellator]|uniref:inositol polyphosphate-5-phosphatase A n=1 Tax=Anopheles bellator TaxID=139047 RepID=UPI00264A4946